MDPFLRLLRYATPHRAVIAGASLAMVVYGAASAALAYLIKPIIDDVLTSRSDLAFVDRRDPRRVSAEGHRRVLFQLPDGRPRPSRGDGRAQSAVQPHARSVGGVFRAPHHRTAAVAHQQRRRAGPARGVRNDRRSRARVAGAGRLRGAAVLLRRQAGAGLHDRRAAGGLSAGPLRQESADRDALEPGSPRAHVACRHRGLHRSSHRQGVRRRAARSRQVRSRLVVAVPHQPEGDRACWRCCRR